MVEYDPEISLNNLIKEARKSVEGNEFDNAINLYRRAIYEFLWTVRSIKVIDSIATINNIFLFWYNLGKIFKLLNDLEGILLMNKTRYSIYDSIADKIPSDKSEFAKQIYKETSLWQQTAFERPISERPEKAMIEEEKLSISEREELERLEKELERALTGMEETGVFEHEEKIEGALTTLIYALKDEDADVRWKAAKALGRIDDAKAVEALIRALKDEYDPVRSSAAQALGRIGAKAVELLIEALKDENLNVRFHVAFALGEIGDPKAIDALTKASKKDIDQNVRSNAKEALKKIKAQRVKEKALFQVIADERWEWRTVDALVRESGMTEEEVRRTLEKYKEDIMKSSIPDKYGNELYTLRSSYIKRKRSRERKLSFLLQKDHF